MPFFPLYAMAQSGRELMESYDFQRGVELYVGDNPDESAALESFSEEVESHPQNGYAWYFMGAIYDDNDLEGKALDCLNKAVKFLKKDKEWLCFAYRLRASIYLQLEKDNLALQDWKAAIKADPKDITAYVERGNYYYANKQYDLAEADYDSAIANDPSSYEAHVNKALVRFALKDYSNAEALYSYSIKLDPSEYRAYYQRALVCLAEKKYGQASDDAITALSIDPHNSLPILRRFDSLGKDTLLAKLRVAQSKDKNNAMWSYYQGVLLENNEEYRKAIKAFEAAYETGPDKAYLVCIARCRASLGDYGAAVDNMNRAIAMDSTVSIYYLYKGNYEYYLGLNKESIATLTSYIDKEPDDSWGYYRRGFVKDNTGDAVGAIEDYSMALVLNPDITYALVQRGDCYKKQGNLAAAEADYERDLQIDTVYNGNCNAQYAYLGLGEIGKAKEVQDSILSHTQNAGTFYDAACLYSKMGEYDKAMEYLKTSFAKGYRKFAHVMNDDDLDALKGRDDFNALMAEYKAAAARDSADSAPSDDASDVFQDVENRISEIPFTRESGGLCKVKCEINGLPLSFWLDTGASDVSLSMVEATFMFKNGYMGKDDVLGSAYFLDANGNVNAGTVINLRSVKFGDAELKNVKASVVVNQKAPLLLGQSVLARLGSIEIDNSRQVIRIKYFAER